MCPDECAGFLLEEATQWDLPSPSLKRTYGSIASSSSLVERTLLEDVRAHVKANLAAAHKRAADELLKDCLIGRLSLCRFYVHQRQRLRALWQPFDDVTELRNFVLSGVDVPPAPVVA